MDSERRSSVAATKRIPASLMNLKKESNSKKYTLGIGALATAPVVTPSTVNTASSDELYGTPAPPSREELNKSTAPAPPGNGGKALRQLRSGSMGLGYAAAISNTKEDTSAQKSHQRRSCSVGLGSSTNNDHHPSDSSSERNRQRRSESMGLGSHSKGPGTGRSQSKGPGMGERQSSRRERQNSLGQKQNSMRRVKSNSSLTARAAEGTPITRKSSRRRDSPPTSSPIKQEDKPSQQPTPRQRLSVMAAPSSSRRERSRASTSSAILNSNLQKGMALNDTPLRLSKRDSNNKARRSSKNKSPTKKEADFRRSTGSSHPPALSILDVSDWLDVSIDEHNLASAGTDAPNDFRRSTRGRGSALGPSLSSNQQRRSKSSGAPMRMSTGSAGSRPSNVLDMDISDWGDMSIDDTVVTETVTKSPRKSSTRKETSPKTPRKISSPPNPKSISKRPSSKAESSPQKLSTVRRKRLATKKQEEEGTPNKATPDMAGKNPPMIVPMATEVAVAPEDCSSPLSKEEENREIVAVAVARCVSPVGCDIAKDGSMGSHNKPRQATTTWACTCGHTTDKSQPFCGMCGVKQHWSCAECQHSTNLCRYVFCAMCGTSKSCSAVPRTPLPVVASTQ